MKKVLLLTVAFMFMVAMAAPTMAADLPKPVDKLTKGVVEIVKSPIVIYDHTKSEMDSADHMLLGTFKGLVESPFHMVKKAGTGALDVATFLID